MNKMKSVSAFNNQIPNSSSQTHVGSRLPNSACRIGERLLWGEFPKNIFSQLWSQVPMNCVGIEWSCDHIWLLGNTPQFGCSF